MRKIIRLIIHCTATPQGREVTIAEIDRWHRARGFDCIGYHYVIYLDGTVHTGRDIRRIGAHCRGYNTGSIGIAYVGGLAPDGVTPADTRTPAQRRSLHRLVTQLRGSYPGVTIHGHNEFAAKACPCFDVGAEFLDSQTAIT